MVQTNKGNLTKLENIFKAIDAESLHQLNDYIKAYGTQILNISIPPYDDAPIFYTIKKSSIKNQLKSIILINMIILGADPNVFDKNQRPLFYYICLQQLIEVAQLMIKYDLSITDKDQKNCLFWIVQNKTLTILNTILKNTKNININHIDINGETALFQAVKASNLAVCKILVQNGCNVNIKNKQNKFAYDYCKDRQILSFFESSIKKQYNKVEIMESNCMKSQCKVMKQNMIKNQKELMDFVNLSQGILKDEKNRQNLNDSQKDPTKKQQKINFEQVLNVIRDKIFYLVKCDQNGLVEVIGPEKIQSVFQGRQQMVYNIINPKKIGQYKMLQAKKTLKTDWRKKAYIIGNYLKNIELQRLNRLNLKSFKQKLDDEINFMEKQKKFKIIKDNYVRKLRYNFYESFENFRADMINVLKTYEEYIKNDQLEIIRKLLSDACQTNSDINNLLRQSKKQNNIKQKIQ